MRTGGAGPRGSSHRRRQCGLSNPEHPEHWWPDSGRPGRGGSQRSSCCPRRAGAGGPWTCSPWHRTGLVARRKT